jgi:GT2 family glycosyltransferase
LTKAAPPPQIVEAARRRAEARDARDWATADQLRAEIEAAGWRVVDSGTNFRLEAVHPPDLVDGEVVRYGRSEAVPTRFGEPDEGLATVVIVGESDAGEVVRAVAGIRRAAPMGVSVVVVANGMGRKGEREIEGAFASETASTSDGQQDADGAVGIDITRTSLELISTSVRLGFATALNIGIRRSIGPVVILLGPSYEAEGDFVTPLVRVLDDPTVAVAGPLGFASADLRRFDEVLAPAPGPVPAAAIEGGLMAFRRADATARGPLDEQFRVARNLDIWWSLVLRDEGEDRSPRRAVVVPDLALRRHEDLGGSSVGSAERERLTKRNYYRVLDRFGRRLDLAVPGD